MRFEELDEENGGTGRLTQMEAMQLLGVCEYSFRRHFVHAEEERIDDRANQHSGRMWMSHEPVLANRWPQKVSKDKKEIELAAAVEDIVHFEGGFVATDALLEQPVDVFDLAQESESINSGQGWEGESATFISAGQFAQTDLHTTDTSMSPTVLPDVTFEAIFVKKLERILLECFSNGFRVDSPIELVRFRRSVREVFDEEIPLSDEKLKELIAACGMLFDGNIYIVSPQTKERIKTLAKEYFESGAKIIFPSEFYEKNTSWLFSESIVSEEMLTSILRQLFPALTFTRTYFGYTDVASRSAVESEILRVWDDDILLTYEQVAKRLPYIPIQRIIQVLGQNNDFIWNSNETFSHIGRISITDEERESIRKVAERECRDRGYCSIISLPLDEIEPRNDELSTAAIHSAVFHVCLSDKFDRKGKIVTRKGDTLDALTILKNHCGTVDKISLNDLYNFEKELTGNSSWLSVEAGNTALIRVSKDTYVVERYVHFNPEVVDAAIGQFVTGNYLPLKSFTAFGMFPDCGQAWNLFLLESYCRRFSRMFRFDVFTANSRNAGVIVRKSCNLNYTEIMVDAVVNAGVSLMPDVVGQFLVDSGFTGRKIMSDKVVEIINRAENMRRRGN